MASDESSEGNALIQAVIELGTNLRLLFGRPELEPQGYTSCRIQKGLIIARDSQELVEEGVGFGLPLVRYGHEIVLPGHASIKMRQKDKRVIAEVIYNLDLLLRRSLRRGRAIESPHFYRIDEFFSQLHRRNPPLRAALIWAAYPLKLLCGLETSFQEIDSAGSVGVTYDARVGDGVVHTSVDLDGLRRDGCKEIIIANEQGANHFDLYRDSNGVTLRGKKIGTWNETLACQAFLVDSRNGISFGLNRVGGARMFRGREVVVNRLAWAGLNYVLPENTTSFSYDIEIGLTL